MDQKEAQLPNYALKSTWLTIHYRITIYYRMKLLYQKNNGLISHSLSAVYFTAPLRPLLPCVQMTLCNQCAIKMDKIFWIRLFPLVSAPWNVLLLMHLIWYSSQGLLITSIIVWIILKLVGWKRAKKLDRRLWRKVVRDEIFINNSASTPCDEQWYKKRRWLAPSALT